MQKGVKKFECLHCGLTCQAAYKTETSRKTGRTLDQKRVMNRDQKPQKLFRLEVPRIEQKEDLEEEDLEEQEDGCFVKKTGSKVNAATESKVEYFPDYTPKGAGKRRLKSTFLSNICISSSFLLNFYSLCVIMFSGKLQLLKCKQNIPKLQTALFTALFTYIL